MSNEDMGPLPTTTGTPVLQVGDKLYSPAGVQGLVDRIVKLQAFKDWTHAWLDSHGVPKEFPDGPHSKEGCRIGDRMDWLWAEMEKLKVELANTRRAMRDWRGSW